MVNDGKQSTSETDAGKITPTGENDGNVGRRTFLKATGVGAGAAALAGCSGTIGGGGDGGIPDTIRLGALGPADSPMGDSILKSAELAVEEINADGGIAGADVTVSTKDTKDDPGTTRSGYQELTTGENVHATVGIFGSENLLSIMGNISNAETVHMTAGAATPEAPARLKDDFEANKYWFRVGPVNADYLQQSMIDYASARFDSMGWDTVAVIAEDYVWTEPITDSIGERLENEVGVEVTSVQRLAEGTEDFTPIYDQLESSGVDGAFTALAHIGTTSLVQWAQQQRPFGYGGIHVPTQLPSFYDATSGAAVSTFSQTTATANSEITDKTVPYANAFAEKYDGALPVYTGYSAYDAVYMLKAAIESGESVASDDIVSELESLTYSGTSGTLEFFGQDGEYPHDIKYGEEYTRGVYFQWQPDGDSGTQEVLWPDKYQQSEYQAPPWV